MSTVIKNGRVVLPDCSGFFEGDVLVEDGVIKAVGGGLRGEDEVDATGKYVLPGLIDIHNHGSIGIHYASDGTDYERLLRFYAEKGVTTVLPTLGTNTIDEMVRYIGNIVAAKRKGYDGARIGGIHLEGPFISTEKKGAMAVKSPPCTVESFNRMLEAGEGEIKLMAIAPERENALDVIREGVRRGVRISLGHTMATYAEAMAAIEAGASHATHTFNAMRDYNHREPGVLGAVLTEPSVMCEAICDMVHLAPATVKLIWRMKGLENMILISDSVMITGLPDGEYDVNGQIRIVKGSVSRTVTGTIAGSCFAMDYGAKNLAELGFSPADVARVGSLNPARAASLEKELGSIEAGKLADIIVCDEKINIERVMLRGRFI